MASAAVSTGVFGLGELGTFTFGEEYIPVSVTVDENVAVSETKSSEIAFAFSEDCGITDSELTQLALSISESFLISEPTVVPRIGISISENSAVSEIINTEIGVVATDTISELEYYGDEYVYEEISIGETVISTLVFSLAESVTITESEATEIGASITETFDFVESLETVYSLSIDEILSIAETVASTVPLQYKTVYLSCKAEVPKRVSLHCKAEVPKSVSLHCAIILDM